MSVWQPYFDIQKYDRVFFHHTNNTDVYHQYKLCQRLSMWAEAAFFISTAQEIVNFKLVNEIPQHNKSSHWVCAQQFHFGHSHAEAQAGKCFQIYFETSNWYWTVRNGSFQNLYYHCIIETCKSCWVLCNCLQVSWFKSLVESLQTQHITGN